MLLRTEHNNSVIENSRSQEGKKKDDYISISLKKKYFCLGFFFFIHPSPY